MHVATIRRREALLYSFRPFAEIMLGPTMSKNHLNTEALTTDFVLRTSQTRYVSCQKATKNSSPVAVGAHFTFSEMSFAILALLTLSSKDSVVVGLGREEAAFLKMDSATASATLTFTT